MKGEPVLVYDIRYFFYITMRTDLSAAEVVRCANEFCDQENVIEQLKNGVGALRVPICDLVTGRTNAGRRVGAKWDMALAEGTFSRLELGFTYGLDAQSTCGSVQGPLEIVPTS